MQNSGYVSRDLNFGINLRCRDMKKIFYIFIFCLLLPPICYAENGNTTAKQIKLACESDESSPSHYLCVGFINGVVQTYLGLQNLTTVYKDKVCLPGDIGLKQLQELFLKHTKSFDENQLNSDADVAIMTVLVLEFPCHTK